MKVEIDVGFLPKARPEIDPLAHRHQRPSTRQRSILSFPTKSRSGKMTITRRFIATGRTLRAQTLQPVPPAQPATVIVNQPPPPPPPAPTVVHQSPTLPTVKVKRSIGGFRGGITGFLLGVVLSSALGYNYLLSEYQNASSVLLTSVEELQQSTGNVTSYIKRIEDVENSLRKVQAGKPYLSFGDLFELQSNTYRWSHERRSRCSEEGDAPGLQWDECREPGS